MSERYLYLPADPSHLEMGAVVFENETPIARTFHQADMVASDHDDLAESIVCEMRLAGDVPAGFRKPFNPEDVRITMKKLVAGQYVPHKPQPVEGTATEPSTDLAATPPGNPAASAQTENAPQEAKVKRAKKPAAKKPVKAKATKKNVSRGTSKPAKKAAAKKPAAKKPAAKKGSTKKGGGRK